MLKGKGEVWIVCQNLADGGIAGLILSEWMFLCQQLTGIRVYTLLMNVDFIPVLKQVKWNKRMLNAFHLIYFLGNCYHLHLDEEKIIC
ncbi:hypothetical protein SAMN05421503_2333 [Terribacillus aidingensis]|uniref:Uncharacterized protein n=1 Tax=Terribacillus aidingensis TaxID=586416 RepID=A0A285P2D2_9BACI|nr:hypothetical protein [Terribacillus aidingensis]SNZ14316.1 hypothetical protein SAMN05421503_2333 [Terribacillus aidingensis]